MNNKLVKALALLLCLIFPLSLAACNSTPTDEGTVNRGRYIEQSITMPGDVYDLMGIDQLADGTYLALAMIAETRVGRSARGEYTMIRSEDGGATWEPWSLPWLDAFNAAEEEDKELQAASFLSADDIYFVVMTSGEEGYVNRLVHVKDGVETVSDYNLRDILPNGSGVQAFRVMDDGNVLAGTDNASTLIEPETGQVLATFPADTYALWGSYAAVGDSLAIAQQQSGKINLYDRGSGRVTDKLPLTQQTGARDEGFTNAPSMLTAITPQEDGSALFYCNSTGLYRVTTDGAVTERLMDGALTSLVMPTIYMQYLFRNVDGSFLAVCGQQEMGTKMFRYVFDPEVPTVPDKELKVYSLTESKTIRQAMGEFQLENPDTKVDYQVGSTGEDGITTADALRNLSTELLAGKGPDILLLDGMPVDSYIEKGILADLSESLDPRIQSGELLANVANTYRRDDKLYAVPARFSVPVLHGVGTDPVTDVTSLADWLDGQELQFAGILAENTMSRLYTVCSWAWFREDGTLDEEAFTRDLAAMGRLAERARNLALENENLYDSEGSLPSGALDIFSGQSLVNIGNIDSLSNLAGPYSTVREIGKGEIKLFPEGGLFLPRITLGLNAASEELERAQDFIGYVLSEKLMSIDFEDGLPVNAAALEATADFDGYQGRGSYGFSRIDKETGEYETLILQTEMPAEEVTRDWIAKFGALETPVLVNDVVRQIIIDETAEYFAGSKPLEDTVQALRAKLDLYLQE